MTYVAQVASCCFAALRLRLCPGARACVHPQRWIRKRSPSQKTLAVSDLVRHRVKKRSDFPSRCSYLSTSSLYVFDIDFKDVGPISIQGYVFLFSERHWQAPSSLTTRFFNRMPRVYQGVPVHNHARATRNRGQWRRASCLLADILRTPILNASSSAICELM